MKGDTKLLMSLVAIYLATIFAVWFGTYAPIVAGLAKNGVNQEWLGFFGNIISGLMTVSAAIGAWFAVQRQIASAEQLAQRDQRDAFEAISAELHDYCEWINEVWRAIDYALARNIDIATRSNRIVVASVVAGTISSSPVEQLEPFIPELSATQRRSMKSILITIGFIERELKALAAGSRRDDEVVQHARIARVNFSHLEKYLRSFNPVLAGIFHGRNIDNVNHQNAAAHIRPFVNERVAR